MQKVLIPIFAAASAALTLVPSAVLAQAPSDADRYAYGPHMMWWGGGWYAMIFGPLFMILFLVMLIATVVFLVRWAGGPWQGTVPASRAAELDIARHSQGALCSRRDRQGRVRGAAACARRIGRLLILQEPSSARRSPP